MAENILINGTTYPGVESVELNTTDGKKVLYFEGQPVSIVQTTGNSETAVMSQKAVTDALVNVDLTNSQTLSENQKAQARENIGAVGAEKVIKAIEGPEEYNLMALATDFTNIGIDEFFAYDGIAKIEGYRYVGSDGTNVASVSNYSGILKFPVKPGDVIRSKLLPYTYVERTTTAYACTYHDADGNFKDEFKPYRLTIGNASHAGTISLVENGIVVPDGVAYAFVFIPCDYYDYTYFNGFKSEIITLNADRALTDWDGVGAAEEYVPVDTSATSTEEFYEIQEDVRIPRYEAIMGEMVRCWTETIDGETVLYISTGEV